MNEQGLQEKMVGILANIKEWRREHPKAKYVEIEEEVHKRLMEVEAQVIEETAQESASREWGRGYEHAAPMCSICGGGLQARGKHKRTLQGNGGKSVTLERTYGTCSKCGVSLFPPG
jgi:hypothetical protein